MQDFGAGLESDHTLHLSPHAHTHGHYEHAGYRVIPGIDPALDQSTGANRNGHMPMSSLHQSHGHGGHGGHQTPNHLLQPDNASLAGAHLSHQFYGDMSRPSQTPSTPSNGSPRFSAISPTSQPKQIAGPFIPNGRNAPDRDVSDDTIDDAYAAFILYCNPSFPTGTDTSELTKLFRIPPKSGSKAFSTWALFELIRKLDRKEIKTWTQLALDLGVEPPDIEKGQSTQKVQQYSVRLKRWMRAMHIDAFFEYLLEKNHPYYMNIPPPHAPLESGRDGVPLEEDLAIRALDPKFRPKRGRRKAEDGDDDMDLADGTPPRKRPQLDTSVPFGNPLQPHSAYPHSAHPDHMEGFLGGHDPWAASAITPSSAMTAVSAPGRMNPNKNLTPYSASPMSGQQLRWRLNTQDNPTTPHPLSAMTPQSAHPDYFDEPQSAITPSSSKPRSRRRHGPAVSSAWPSNNASSTGKLRGRPPSNRSVRDGPFVTFPANPKTKEAPTIDMNRGNLTPIVERAHSDPPMPNEHHFRFPPTPSSAVSPNTIEAAMQSSSGKPHRLSLQVPQNVGNPVRLVTPTVLVNGEQNSPSDHEMSGSNLNADTRRGPPRDFFSDNSGEANHHNAAGTMHPPSQRAQQSQQGNPATELPNIPLSTLNRALAAELIRAPLTGPRKRLRGTEAKNLASAILSPLYASKPNNNSSSNPSTSKIMTDNILGIAISSCLGLCSSVGLGVGGPTGGVRRIECARYRVGGDGYESPIDEEDEEYTSGIDGGGTIKESFDVYFGVNFGGLVGEWGVKGLDAVGDEGENGDEGVAAAGDGGERREENLVAGWKAKFVEAQRRLWVEREGNKVLRERILEAVL